MKSPWKKNHRFRLLLLLIAPFLAGPLRAGPFLSVQKADTSQFPRVDVYLRVSNMYYQPLRNLGEKHFQLLENGWLVNYTRIKEMRPAFRGKEVTLLMDITKSINQKAFERGRQAARVFLDSKAAEDRVALVRFNSHHHLELNLTENTRQAREAIDHLKREGKKTRLFDALYYTLGLAGVSANPRKAVLLISDGWEEDSSMTLADCLELAAEKEVPVYVIALSSVKSKKDRARHRMLGRLARKTGGEMIPWPSPDKLVRLYSQIGNRLATQYILRYQSQLKGPDGLTPLTKSGEQPLHLRVDFQYENIEDSDSLTTVVSPAASWRDWFTTERILYILLALLFLLLVAVVLVLSRKDRFQFILRRREEKELKNLLEENYSREFIQPPVKLSRDDSRNIAPEADSGRSTATISAAGTPGARSQAQMGAKRAKNPGPVSYEGGQNQSPVDPIRAGAMVHREKIRPGQSGLAPRRESTRVRQNLDYAGGSNNAGSEPGVRSRAWLVVRRGAQAGKKIPLYWENTTLGRDPENNICIEDGAVSPRHGRVRKTDGGYILFDLLSKNGIYVNNRKLLKPRSLRDGDEIRLGESVLLFRQKGTPGRSHPGKTPPKRRGGATSTRPDYVSSNQDGHEQEALLAPWREES